MSNLAGNNTSNYMTKASICLFGSQQYFSQVGMGRTSGHSNTEQLCVTYKVNIRILHVRVTYTPLNPPLYSKTGLYRGIQFFSFLIQNIDCGYSLVFRINVFSKNRKPEDQWSCKRSPEICCTGQPHYNAIFGVHENRPCYK